MFLNRVQELQWLRQRYESGKAKCIQSQRFGPTPARPRQRRSGTPVV